MGATVAIRKIRHRRGNPAGLPERTPANPTLRQSMMPKSAKRFSDDIML